jgi:Fe2+ transport system protein FeoA
VLPGLAPDTPFSAVPDGAGNTLVTDIACFAAGTRIRTETGDRPVEALRIGDRLVLAAGGSAPIAWIGHRSIACHRHPRPRDVLPIRVQAGAFGPDMPIRDLLLSPDHAVLADGVLIPVRYLVNGSTVARHDTTNITYFHVELPAHGVVLAEGLPCESYLDTGNRNAFANAGAAVALHPDFARRGWSARACAELVLDGPHLAAVRRRLLQRALAVGFGITDDAELRLLAGGRLRPPLSIEADRHRFAIPANAKIVRIVSRSGIPAEIATASSDHRRLGVMLTRIVLRRPGWPQELPLEAIPPGGGLHAMEREADRSWRWTDGRAELRLPAGFARGSEAVLDLHVAATQRCWTAASAGEMRPPQQPPQQALARSQGQAGDPQRAGGQHNRRSRRQVGVK